MKIRPLGDRILVEPLEQKEIKKGGIIIPDTAKEKPQEGKVVAVGPGKLDDSGKKIPMDIKVGDIVGFKKGIDYRFKIDEKEYIRMPTDYLLYAEVSDC